MPIDIALVQLFLPEDPREAFEQGLSAIKDAANAGADLIAFPELAFSAFYPRLRIDDREGERRDILDGLSEPVPGPTTEAIQDVAREYGVVVVFNLFEKDGDRYYDTSPVVDADGTLLGATRMMHITQYTHFYEQDYYDPGDTGAPVYDTAVGRIGVAICYDRHFPEYLRALALQDADLVLVPQAGTAGEWPKGLYEAELQTAAFQNGYAMALANRVGREGDMHFDGRSFVADSTGQIVAQAPANESTIMLASLDLDKAATSPARTLFHRHRRPDLYERGAVSLAGSVPAHRPLETEEEE